MHCQPDHGHGQNENEDQKNNSPFPSLLSERTRPFLPTAVVSFVVERDRSIEAIASFACAQQQLLTLPPFNLLRQSRRIRDHFLEFLHLVAQLRFLLRQLLFGLIEGSCRSKRAPKHAWLPGL